MKKRQFLFDNMKVLLMCLVVFGHFLEKISIEGGYGIIRAWIYSFHMPAFVFISGYFSKHTSEDEIKTITYCLIPYFVFNTAYSIYIHKTLIVNMFTPQYIFWYLFCLAIWRLSISYLKRIKGILGISIILGLYIGVIYEADRFMSISRLISFLPFFLTGYFCKPEEVIKVRKLPRICTISLAALLLGSVTLLHTSKLIPVKAYEEIQCYQKSGMSNIQGIMVRGFSYIVGMLAIVCLINLISDRERWYTKYGRRTIVIYVASVFSVMIIYRVLGVFSDFMVRCVRVGVLFGTCATGVTFFVFGSESVYNLYIKIIEYIGKFVKWELQ